MKFPLVIFTAVTVMAVACSPQVIKPVTNNITTSCKDTSVNVLFINTKPAELSVHILIDNVKREGNTIVHTWTKFRQFTLKPGADMVITLSTNYKFMYDVYGPVSTNVNGIGIIASKKMELVPCQKAQEEI